MGSIASRGRGERDARSDPHRRRGTGAGAADPQQQPDLAGELARGLALWAARYQCLPGEPQGTGPLDAVQATARLPRLPGDVPSSGPGVSGRLQSLVRLRDLPDALDEWGCDGSEREALDALIGAAARVVAARPDAPIAYCHAVTAPSAIQMILPELPPELHRPSVNASWQVIGSIVAAYADPRSAAETEPIDTDPAPLLADSRRGPSNTATSTSSSSPRRPCANTGARKTPRCWWPPTGSADYPARELICLTLRTFGTRQ